MELSTAQIRAIENGEAVPVTVGHTKCVLMREDLYERVKAVLDQGGVGRPRHVGL